MPLNPQAVLDNLEDLTAACTAKLLEDLELAIAAALAEYRDDLARQFAVIDTKCPPK